MVTFLKREGSKRTQNATCYIIILQSLAHRQFRGIECRVLKICDFKKVILSLFFKHNIAGLGVLIPKRYHMLG